MKSKFLIIGTAFFMIVSTVYTGAGNVIANQQNIDHHSNSQEVIVSVNHYASRTYCFELSLNETKEIIDRFLEINERYDGFEKVDRQIKLFQKRNILSNNFSLKKIYFVLQHLQSLQIFNKIGPAGAYAQMILDGPMIVSHFTVNGRIKSMVNVKPFFYKNYSYFFKDFLNGSRLTGVVGVLPGYVGFSLKPVHVSILGFNTPKFYKNVYCPFLEVLIPCVGTSIAFVVDPDDSKEIVLFEFNVDGCLFGMILGLPITFWQGPENCC